MPATPPLELHDVESAERFLARFWLPWWQWLALGAAVLALLVVLAIILRRTRQPRTDPAAALRRAQLALAALAERPPSAISQLATDVSLVLRRFLAEASGDPALYQTREEFVSRSDALAALPATERTATTELFAELAELKYAPASHAPAVGASGALVARATRLLETLHQALRRSSS